MRVQYSSEAAPGADNEDCVVAGNSWVVLLDGATVRVDVDSGCRHGPRWLVRRLAGNLAGRLAAESGEALADLLAEAIQRACAAHSRCDLGNPESPSATVTMLRRRNTTLDWLVLADSPLVLDLGGRVRVVRDDRVDRLPDYTVDTVRAARNSAGGFWVASTRPEAAYEAVTGEIGMGRVDRAGMFSDGAARLVEVFGTLEWADLLELLDRAGPQEVIRRTRAAERAGGARAGVRRGKVHDDATAVLVGFR